MTPDELDDLPDDQRARHLSETAFKTARQYDRGSVLRTNAYLAAIYHRLTAMDLAAQERPNVHLHGPATIIGGGGSGGGETCGHACEHLYESECRDQITPCRTVEEIAADPAPVVPSTPKPTKKAAPARKRATRKPPSTSKETSA